MKKSILYIFFLSFLIGCDQKKNEITNEILKVTAGKDFTITLDSNPSTGHRWTLCNYTPTSPIKLKDHQFEEGKTQKATIGAPGKEKFIFETEKIGHQATVYINFNYVGPAQDGSTPAKQVFYTLNIT